MDGIDSYSEHFSDHNYGRRIFWLQDLPQKIGNKVINQMVELSYNNVSENVKGDCFSKTQIRPSKIAMMLKGRQCEDEWKVSLRHETKTFFDSLTKFNAVGSDFKELTDISSAYREDHEKELYGRSYYPQKNRYKDILPCNNMSFHLTCIFPS